MTFFPEPIKPSEGKQEGEYRANPIEADRHAREKFVLEEEAKKKREGLYGAFLVFLGESIKDLGSGFVSQEKTHSRNTFEENMKELQTLLQSIQSRDQSKSSQFRQQFSKIWVLLLQDSQVLVHTKRVGEGKLRKISTLLGLIAQYPVAEEHQLGYYLSHYSGEDWLPIPFRDILQRLHNNHVELGMGSVLSRWVELIEDLLQS